MNASDFMFIFVIPFVVISSCTCSFSRSAMNDDIKILRKRVNDLELRIIRIEWKIPIRGEVANETRD